MSTRPSPSSDTHAAPATLPAMTGEAPEQARRSAGFATTAFGPAEARDTPRVSSTFESGAETEAADPWIGRILSNVYQVEGKIGEGGMGAVYSARHVHLGKQYAVKVLSTSIASNVTAVDRLKQEAIAASSIDHDNIVEVISFDRYTDGAVFIVMEYLRGENLADRIARGPLTLHEALPIAHQIASALSAAHARGIVHRDLKPENVFLARKGELERAKVLDFGISKVKSADAEQVKMTRTGQMVGTPLYMSPEQSRGESEIDHLVDVYALGVILFEMLTGSPPFDGRNYFELLWKHGNEAPPSMRSRNPNRYIPDGVDAVVMRALAKRREERFASMDELSRALAFAAPDVPVPGSTSLPPARQSSEVSVAEALASGVSQARTESIPASSGSKNRVLGAAAFGVVLLLGVGWAALRSGGAPASPTPRVPGASTLDAPPAERVPSRPTEAADGVRDVDALPAGAGARPDPVAEEGGSVGAPSLVTVTLESSPMGAEVRLGDRVLGTTPCRAELADGSAAQLVFHRDGYLDAMQDVVAAAGGRVSPTLRPRRRSTGSGAPGSSSLPMKTEL